MPDPVLKELRQSITKNIKGKCIWSISTGKQSNNTYHIVAYAYPPSKQEITSYQNLPITWTKGNSKSISILNGKRLTDWANEPESRWMIPEDHPGQNRMMCMNLTRSIGLGKIESFYAKYRKQYTGSYMLKGTNALINHQGMVMFNCGYYQGVEGCETRWNHEGETFWFNCRTNYTNSQTISWISLLQKVTDEKDYEAIQHCSHNNSKATKFDKVFVISSMHDFNFHHLISDSLARMSRYLSYLQHNSDIKIFIRAWEKYERMERTELENYASIKSRSMLLSLLGFNESRIIFGGTVVANEVFIPRATKCSFALANPFELRILAKKLIIKARKDVKLHNFSYNNSVADDEWLSKLPTEMKISKYFIPTYQMEKTDHDPKKKNLVILHRKNKNWGSRDWNDETFEDLRDQLAVKFSNHSIIHHHSDHIFHPKYCLSCEIIQMTTADILVGTHGAGLTMQMFMPMNSIIFEINGHLNDAMMPVCGYYGNMAAIFGHHHYLYSFDHDNGNEGVNENMDSLDIANELYKYYQFIHQLDVLFVVRK